MIAPASWRLPPALRQGSKPAGGGRALGRWRRAAGVPRMVQVGEGDELYPVDLQAPGAAAELAAYERVFEIWPPLESVVDCDGRRVEAIVAVVDEEVEERAPPALHARAPGASRRRARSRRSPAGAPSSCSARPPARTPCSSGRSCRR